MTSVYDTDHLDGKVFNSSASPQVNTNALFPQQRIHPEYLPGGRKSLAGISSHAFGLGVALGLCSLISGQLAYHSHYLWRVPFFITILAVFHFLEFYITARYNPPDARVSSYLLFSNGRAYNIAHTTAVVEALLRHWTFNLGLWSGSILPAGWQSIASMQYIEPSVLVGIAFIVVGQCMRSVAMKQAGTSFNHIVQSLKKEDHVLITTGIYRFSRHPAYCGFFWWGLGTQLVLGNHICFLVYTIVLWRFFSHRIGHEEQHLLRFFGDEYKRFRDETPVLIPFIR